MLALAHHAERIASALSKSCMQLHFNFQTKTKAALLCMLTVGAPYAMLIASAYVNEKVRSDALAVSPLQGCVTTVTCIKLPRMSAVIRLALQQTAQSSNVCRFFIHGLSHGKSISTSCLVFPSQCIIIIMHPTSLRVSQPF